MRENFAPLLEKYKSFFKKYYPKFVLSFLELLKKQNPNLKIDSSYKEFAKSIYENLFLKKEFEPTDILRHYDENLKEIDLDTILNKTMLLMTNNFIKHILKEENSISTLKEFVTFSEFFIEYITHLKKTPPSKEEIPIEIQNAYKDKEKIYIFNVYKGIPITHNTFIEKIESKKITLKANYYQLIASKFQKNIYLLLPELNKTYKAVIDSINQQDKTVTIYNIQEITRPTIKRNYIRVQPKEKIKALINNQEGTIYDISLKGIAIDSKKLDLHVGDFAQIEFDLNHPFEITAELKSITKFDDTYRYHFYFSLPLKEEKILEKYISDREKEIIKELHIFLKREFIDLS